MNKLVSKLFRQRLAKDLKACLEALPLEGLRESQVGNHVYMGRGKVRVGASAYPVQVRVWIRDGLLTARVQTEDQRLRVEGPFATLEERQTFPRAVQDGLRMLLN